MTEHETIGRSPEQQFGPGAILDEDRTLTFNGTFKPPEIVFLWKPYLPRRKAVLLDADGSIGKTSFMLAVAACMEQGVTPITGAPCEPVSTLYVGLEDDQGDYETVYRANGGSPGTLRYETVPLTLNQRGLDRIQGLVTARGHGLVLLDGLFDFLGGAVKEASEPVVMAAVMQRVNEFARYTNATVIISRHTTKDHKDKSPEQLGMGSSMIRNKARGQLLMRYHKDFRNYPGVRVVQDLRASIRREMGEPFAFDRSGEEGALMWRHDVDLSDYRNGMVITPRGPAPAKTNDARAVLLSVLADGPVARREAIVRVLEIMQSETGAMPSISTIDRARERCESIVTVNGLWQLDSYDPFED